MPKLRFLSSNRYNTSATVLAASSAAAALPVGATQNPDRSYVWRSLTQTGVQTIDIDLGSVLAVTSIAVANVKLVGTGGLELYERGDAGSPGAATLVATLPAQDRDTRTAFAFFTSQSHRHWQLKWTNPTAASDYAELGYAFLGTYTEVARNIRVPASIRRPDPSQAVVSVDGQKVFRRRTKYFTGTWEFLEVGESELSTHRALFDAIGVGTPHFVVLDTSLAWSCWFARFVEALEFALSELAGRYNVGLAWEEVR